MKPKSIFFLITLFLLTLLHPHPATAHNGAVAIAVPIEGIMVDGDLSDWPEGMREYPIKRCEHGDAPKDSADFQGSFRIGYSEEENALYIAVEALDQSIVVDTASAAVWDAQDGCEIYINVVHDRENAPGGQYFVRGESLGMFGSQARMDDFAAAVQRDARSHSYEWRIDVERRTEGKVRLRGGMSLGVDVVLCDRDGDGSFSWVAWGPGAEKHTYSTRHGDVVLVADRTRTGTVSGQATWASGQPAAYVRVRVQSQRSDKLWVQAETDREGEFTVVVPLGSYSVQCLTGPGEKKATEVDVRLGESTEVAFSLKALPWELYKIDESAKEVASEEVISPSLAEYNDLIAEANSLFFEVKDYEEAAEAYERALENPPKRFEHARYYDYQNAAGAMTLSGKTDKAIEFLHRAVDEGHLNLGGTAYKPVDGVRQGIDITYDENLNSLHGTIQWEWVLRRIDVKKRQNKPLLDEFRQIGADDQRFRQLGPRLIRSMEEISDTLASLRAQQAALDSVNRTKLDSIVVEHGWPSIRDLGSGASGNAWVVVQHAPLEYIELYLPTMQQAADNGDMSMEHLSMTLDRIRYRNDEPQIYGTHTWLNPETGEREVMPMEDPTNVNKRRRELGLMTLEKYHARGGFTIPKAEAEDKK
jgi:tetratricopeptide (TPR) repeat protein